jgi:diguanylate cyclase (GGDEF)-like protein
MTNGTSLRTRAVRLGIPQKIMLLTACVAALAVALFVVVVRPLPGAPTALTLPWVLWAAAFVVAEALVVHVQWQREAHTFSMGDLVLGAGLLLATPRDLVIAQVVGFAITLVLHRRQRGIKLAFNLAISALGASLATTIFAGLAGPGLWDWLAALIAVLVITVVADLCIFGVISISEGRAHLAPLVEMLALSLPFTLGSAAVGLVLARSAVSDPAALALLALPTFLIIASYRAYTGAREQQENLRLLHEVTSLLHTSGDSEDALGDFLDSVRSAFRAEMAELVLLGPSGHEGATVTRSREGVAAVVMAPLEETEDHDRLLRLATASGALATRTGNGRGQHLDAYASGRGLKDAMVAALRTDDRVHGLLLVGSRLGDVTTFSRSDLALLDTFARHVATSLERGRLEENLRQVTDLKEQLRHQALHDPLTGLPNRTLFLDRVRHAVDSAGRSGEPPAVLYLDLDGFKPVNDTYGHEAGDVLLRTVADRLRGCLRPADTAARLGGDEFVVLLNGPIDRFGVGRVVDRIRAQLDVPVLLGEDVVTTVGASIGVALGNGVSDADTLVRHADIAMYAAKRAAGSEFLLYEPGLGSTTSGRKDSTAELAAAIDNGELRTVYQPLVDLRSGRPIGAEALVRWDHPTDGLRSPDQFIGLAEDSGLITRIGEHVLNDACAQAARWMAESNGRDDLLVTVNLSARQVADEQIVDQVRAALDSSGIEPHRLVLEITETVLMQDRDAAAATLWTLKGLGVRIAIDDFGTGYSSLAYLRRFPIDMLKVAREFVDGLGRDAHDDVITRAIVELAGTLGLLTVAEGIETTQQSETVAALGCDIAQGYLFSRPLGADAVSAVLSASASLEGFDPGAIDWADEVDGLTPA